jgi:hypothetical protein
VLAYHSEADKLLVVPSKFLWIPTDGLLGSAYNHSHWKKWTVPIRGRPSHIAVQQMTQPQWKFLLRQQQEQQRAMCVLVLMQLDVTMCEFLMVACDVFQPTPCNSAI